MMMSGLTLSAWADRSLRLNYAYRGLVPGYGRSHQISPSWYSNWFIDEGWAEIRIGGRRVRAQTGEWLLCPPWVERYQSFATGSRILSVAFAFDWPIADLVQSGLPLVLGRRDGRDLERAGGELIRRIYGTDGAEHAASAQQPLSTSAWLSVLGGLTVFLRAWLQQVGREIESTSMTLDQRVQQARRHLLWQPQLRPVPYADLTELTGVGRVQLDRLFRSELDASPKTILDRAVLQRVVEHLADRERPIKAIADECGFTDTSHLCKWFAKRWAVARG